MTEFDDDTFHPLFHEDEEPNLCDICKQKIRKLDNYFENANGYFVHVKCGNT